jgi:hypothetical protein
MNFFKMMPVQMRFSSAMHFSQEEDFPWINLLLSGSRTQEELFSVALYPQEVK